MAIRYDNASVPHTCNRWPSVMIMQAFRIHVIVALLSYREDFKKNPIQQIINISLKNYTPQKCSMYNLYIFLLQSIFLNFNLLKALNLKLNLLSTICFCKVILDDLAIWNTSWVFKDAISVSFRSELFTSYILTIFRQ